MQLLYLHIMKYNMKGVFLLFIFSTLALNVNGQSASTTIDSLQQVLISPGLDNRKKVDVLNELGYLYWVINSRESVSYGKKGLALADSIAYPTGSAMARRVLGVGYWTLGELKLALEKLTEAEKLYLETGDMEGAANCLMNTAMVYADIQEYGKALDIYNRSIQKFTELGLDGRIATTFTKIGTVLMEQGRLQDAKEYFTNALRMHARDSFVYGQAEAQNRLGTLFLIEGEAEQAEHHLRRARALSEHIDDKDGLISSQIQFGKLLRLEGKHGEAGQELEQALQIADERKLKKYQLSALFELKLLEKEMGNLEKALLYNDSYIDLKDSIYDTNKSKQIAALEFSNELEDKEKELALLQEQERLDAYIKWGLLAGVIALTVISLLIIHYQRQQSVRNKELMASCEALAASTLENARLRERELQSQLDFKNKELTSYALNFVQKNELLQELQEKIKSLKNGTPAAQKESILELDSLIRKHIGIDRDWEDFKRVFEEVHTDFHKKLMENHPELSANDLKICALTRLNLNIKETAGILNISPESVKTARYRLRKKLGLEPEEELLPYLLKLESSALTQSVG